MPPELTIIAAHTEPPRPANATAVADAQSPDSVRYAGPPEVRLAVRPRWLMRVRTYGFVGIAAVASGQAAQADPLITSAGVLTRLLFTDNLYMSSVAQESDTILQVLPNITSGGRGRLSSWRFFYGPSALFYAGHSKLNRVYQVLAANAYYDLIEDYLGISVAANANPNLIDPGTENSGFNAVANPDAFAQTASVSVTPVIRFPILRGDFASVRFEPGVNYVFTSNTAYGGRSGTSGSASSLTITSGDYFSRIPWNIRAESYLIGNGGTFGNSSDLADRQTGSGQVVGNATYVMTPQWQVSGLIGYDFGNYQSLEDPNGFRWRVTPYWQPSPNTRIGVGYGYRFYAPDYFLDLSYRTGRTALSAKFDSNVSNARNSIAGAQPVAFQDAFGQPIVQPLQDQLLLGSTSNPALIAGYYIQQSLQLTASQRFARSSLSLTVSSSRYNYQDTDQVVTQSQGSMTLERSLTRRASGTLGLQYWTYDAPEATASSFDQVSFWTEYTYRLTRRSTGSVRYIYNQQISDYQLRSFDANSLWLTLDWSM